MNRGTICALSIMALFIAGDAVQSQKLLKGPYVQNIQRDRATVCWVTHEATVKFGDASRPLNRMATHFKVHEIVLDHLKPNTIYDYDIGGGEARKGHFRTAPEFGTPFRFVVYGDTRFADKPTNIQAQLISALSRQAPALVINTGDIVTDGLNPVHWDTFFEMNAELIKSVPYYVSLGNHEKNSPLLLSIFFRAAK